MTKAIVVGAGAAGASAAFRLSQAGCAVRLLESNAEVGGRTRTRRLDGFIMDIAAGLMPSTYEAVYRLMDDAGLKDMLAPMRSPTAIWRDGRLHYIHATHLARSMLKTRVIGWGSKVAILRAAFSGMAMWNTLGFDNLGLAGPYDTTEESLGGYARRVLNEELLEYLVNPMQKLMYVMSADRASVVDLFWSAKNLFADDAYCVKGGMGRIVDLITDRLDVTLNTRVLSVDEVDERVTVRMRSADGVESTETADICVIATPANIVPLIDRGLSEPGRGYLERLQYSTLSDVHVRLKSRPAENAVLIMVPDSADADLCGILLDHNKGADRAPPGKGLLSIYMNDSWVRANWALPDAEIFRAAMTKVERVMPGVSDLVEGFTVQRWEYAATLSHPGCYKELATFVEGLDLKRRVQLAGDYFTLASVNGAVRSGELVAKRLIDNYVR